MLKNDNGERVNFFSIKERIGMERGVMMCVCVTNFNAFYGNDY